MALELYATRAFINYRGRISKLQQYWGTDNTTGSHAFAVGRELAEELFITTPWIFTLMSLITDKAFLRSFHVQRIRPSYCASVQYRFRSGDHPGLYPGQCGDNFTTANFHWSYASDFTGKSMSRVGPLGEGAFDANGPTAVFDATAFLWASITIATHVLPSGLSFRSQALTKTGVYFPINQAWLSPQPGRQSNRRWVA